MHRLKLISSLLAGFALIFNTSVSAVANDDNTIRWAGCGITKKAFMAELAKGYEKKTGIKVLLAGGGQHAVFAIRLH